MLLPASGDFADGAERLVTGLHEPRRSRLARVLIFMMHQLIGTWGIGISAYFLGAVTLDLVSLGRPYSMQPLHWILTETPFFPAQVILGFYSGWYFGRRLRHRSMLWVWLIPGLILAYATLTRPDLTSQISVLAGSSDPLSHYFGWGCQPKNHCFDQLLVTMPFYAATAYSIGGRLGLNSVAAGT